MSVALLSEEEHNGQRELTAHVRRCRAGRRASGLLKGHPAKLLRPSLHKASGLAFDGGKLNEIYQSKVECELAMC